MLLECGRKHVSLEPGIEPSFSPLTHRAAQVTTPIVRQIGVFAVFLTFEHTVLTLIKCCNSYIFGI